MTEISDKLAKSVKLDCSVDDPNELEFSIYKKEEMMGINEITKFRFGTAVGGLYRLRLTIYCEVSRVNIAYLVKEIHEEKIPEDEEEPEDTDDYIKEKTEDAKDNMVNEYKEIKASIPIEFTILSLVSMGSLFTIVLFTFYIHRRYTIKEMEKEISKYTQSYD
ncbi:MAG: hypothetical protein GF353_28255 [Candidatus Lokiarchaeota archaeon]|nr:hypothetical protein [Candidatus Lokiarchaeota archaeon]